MSKLDEFLAGAPKGEGQAPTKPVGMPWDAAVSCQFCHEPVDEQTLYPQDKVLVWTCSQGHRSFMENYSAF